MLIRLHLAADARRRCVKSIRPTQHRQAALSASPCRKRCTLVCTASLPWQPFARRLIRRVVQLLREVSKPPRCQPSLYLLRSMSQAVRLSPKGHAAERKRSEALHLRLLPSSASTQRGLVSLHPLARRTATRI